MKNKKIVIYSLILLIIFEISSCSQKSSTSLSDSKLFSVLVSWDSNRESAVNTTGGGYKVYYSRKQNFKIKKAKKKDVPYVSGEMAPSSTKLQLKPGTWYFKVVAYSSLGDGYSSEPSEEQTIKLK